MILIPKPVVDDPVYDPNDGSFGRVISTFKMLFQPETDVWNVSVNWRGMMKTFECLKWNDETKHWEVL